VASISGVVELLYWEGCPSHDQALADLRELLGELGHGDLAVHKRRIETDAEALSEGFIGSPTIRVNGVDAFPPGDAEPAALTCRVYRLRDGRYSPTPDRDDLRDALSGLL
jgi:hypothetical protein